MVLRLDTGPLTVIGLCNTTLLKGHLLYIVHASTLFRGMLEKMFDQNQNILPTKMLNKRHQTCILHIVTLLIQQMFYNYCMFEHVARA